MTYCVGAMIDAGLVFASDSRTNAGVDNVSTFRKMKLYEHSGERVIVIVNSGNLAVTDLGRIASHYYIKHSTIQAFNHMLAPHLSDPDAVHVLCSSAEFDQLKVRPEELPEIDNLKKHPFLQVKTSTDDTAGATFTTAPGVVLLTVSSFATWRWSAVLTYHTVSA